jgi:hypothetical protein
VKKQNEKKLFFLKQLMSNLLGEAELFWKNYLAKQLHKHLHA